VADYIVHIGYPKTASSWLQQVVFPRLRGVASLWDDPVARQLVGALAHAPDAEYDPEPLRALLAARELEDDRPQLLSEELLSGTVFHDPGSWIRTLERLRHVVPAARILVFTRRQSEMLAALYAQYVLDGGYRSGRDFLADRHLEGWSWEWRHLEYDRLVGSYAKAFGDELVRVLPYEFLRARPEQCLAEVAAFCGADGYAAGVSGGRVNRSLSPRSLALLRHANRLLVRSRFNARPLLGPRSDGQRLALFLRYRVDPLLRRLRVGESGSRARGFESAARRYADSNRRLQRWVAEPLGAYGYPGVDGGTLPLSRSGGGGGARAEP
jgi:hypothetical protein